MYIYQKKPLPSRISAPISAQTREGKCLCICITGKKIREIFNVCVFYGYIYNRMKKYLPFLVIGGAAIGLYFYSKVQAAKKIKVNFKDVFFGEIKGFRIPDIYARFTITNPTNTALSVTSIAGDIYMNNEILTSLQNLEKIDIPANSEIIYKIKITTAPLQLIQALYKYFKHKQKVTFAFKGTVNSSGFVIPLDQIVYSQK